MTSPTRALPGFVPPTPDADTGRQLLRDELTDPIYDQQPSLLERAISWFLDQLAGLRLDASMVEPGVAGGVIALLALVAVGLALYLAGPVRRARRRTTTGAVLGDDARTADQIRADADRHAEAGEWDDATLDRFRAVLRSLEERVVLDERPGRTAHEAADEASRAFPGAGTSLAVAAALFDGVCYGDQRAGRADHDTVQELDLALADLTPVRESALAASGEPA